MRWANQRVASSGSPLRIERCGDESMRTGVFLLQMLRVVAPDCVDGSLIYAGGTQQEGKRNAECWRLQPCVPEAATLCTRGCNPV